MGHPGRILEDSSAKSDEDCGGIDQEVTERSNNISNQMTQYSCDYFGKGCHYLLSFLKKEKKEKKQKENQANKNPA